MQVVALDLAGQETGQRNAAHKEAFSLAHRKFMNKTVRHSPATGRRRNRNPGGACYLRRRYECL